MPLEPRTLYAMFPAGRLNTRVVVRRRTATNDGGQVKYAWADAAACWAEVKGRRSEERPGLVPEGFTELEVTFRHGVDVRGGDRLFFDNVEHEVLGDPADPDGRRALAVVAAVRRRGPGEEGQP